MRRSVFGAIVLVIICAQVSESQLTLGASKCGQKSCKLFEYCSRPDLFCRSCSEICNRNSHNYEEAECITYCQDYLHDLLYVRKDGSGSEDLRAVVQRMHTLVTVSLTLICFVLLIIAAFIGFQVYRWKKKKGITLSTLSNKLFSKKSDNNGNKTPSNVSIANGKADLRLEIPTPGTQSEHSPVTATTSISRRPAEDSALDYAYDNPAMTSSPTNSNKPHESSL